MKLLLAFVGGLIAGAVGAIGALVLLLSDREPLVVDTDELYPPPRDPYLDEVVLAL